MWSRLRDERWTGILRLSCCPFLVCNKHPECAETLSGDDHVGENQGKEYNPDNPDSGVNHDMPPEGRQTSINGTSPCSALLPGIIP